MAPISKLAAVTAPLALGLTGASAPANPPAATPAAAPATQPATRPSMVKEAALPQGFPEPGPLGEIVIKHYPAARGAVVRAADLKPGNSDSMFMSLFNHIKKNHIAMSAPVDMTWSIATPATKPDAAPDAAAGPDASPGVANAKPETRDEKRAEPTSMAFLYLDPHLGHVGKDGVVEVVDQPALTVVSVTLRGDYTPDHFSRGVARLTDWLAAHKTDYQPAGPPRYLCYNSPFVPSFLKIGEVQIPVTPTK